METIHQVVIITGAAGGIGLAIAKKFAGLNAAIVLADLNKDSLDKASEEVKKAGAAEVWPYECDVSQEVKVSGAFDGAIERFGKVDVVINNAGRMIFKPLEEQTVEDWENIFKVDLYGAFFFIKHSFLKMKRGGSIVNIASIHAIETEPMVAPYAAAKAGLLSLTRSAALEGKPKGIRVNAILPGAIDTPMLWNNPNVKSGVEKINKEDVGEPDDIANAAVYLCSDKATFIQGAMLRVDGGRLDRL
jgi:NAD(P)-dependent dehydrogenase (short-subunit alcohol dehydrogenase family)